MEDTPVAVKRDIDLLFVGNFHAAVQQERLPWLGRLAPFADRWHIVLATCVFGADYRHLLSRSRIVFNRSIRGEANSRAFEAVAAGALLMQEAGNLELHQLFRDGQECVYYEDHNLEQLLSYYLEHEDARATIAAAAHGKLAQCTFEAFWDQHLKTIDDQWHVVAGAHAARDTRHAALSLQDRVWQLASSVFGTDTTLEADIAEAAQHAPAHAHQAALQATVEARQRYPDLNHLATGYRRAWDQDPRQVVAGTSLSLVLEQLGQRESAACQAQHVLIGLDRRWQADPDAFDVVPYPLRYDTFRVAWERAAWENAGQRDTEITAKTSLLRWQLHSVLARTTGSLVHEYEACLLRPNCPLSRATLGASLLRENCVLQSLTHLQAAIQRNPFDCDTARLYHEALGKAGQSAQQHTFAHSRRALSQVAEQLVPREPWFAAAARPGPVRHRRGHFVWYGRGPKMPSTRWHTSIAISVSA